MIWSDLSINQSINQLKKYQKLKITKFLYSESKLIKEYQRIFSVTKYYVNNIMWFYIF